MPAAAPGFVAQSAEDVYLVVPARPFEPDAAERLGDILSAGG